MRSTVLAGLVGAALLAAGCQEPAPPAAPGASGGSNAAAPTPVPTGQLGIDFVVPPTRPPRPAASPAPSPAIVASPSALPSPSASPAGR
jgi:hypothetical protein